MSLMQIQLSTRTEEISISAAVLEGHAGKVTGTTTIAGAVGWHVTPNALKHVRGVAACKIAWAAAAVAVVARFPGLSTTRELLVYGLTGADVGADNVVARQPMHSVVVVAMIAPAVIVRQSISAAGHKPASLPAVEFVPGISAMVSAALLVYAD